MMQQIRQVVMLQCLEDVQPLQQQKRWSPGCMPKEVKFPALLDAVEGLPLPIA